MRLRPTISLHVRQNLLDLLDIGLIYEIALSETALTFCGLFGQDMTGERFAPFDLSCTCCFEALCSTSVSFHFRHNCTPLSFIQCCPDYCRPVCSQTIYQEVFGPTNITICRPSIFGGERIVASSSSASAILFMASKPMDCE